MGIAMLCGQNITTELKNQQLITILDDYKTEDVDIYALYSQTSHLPRRARLFLDYIVKQFNAEGYW